MAARSFNDGARQNCTRGVHSPVPKRAPPRPPRKNAEYQTVVPAVEKPESEALCHVTISKNDTVSAEEPCHPEEECPEMDPAADSAQNDIRKATQSQKVQHFGQTPSVPYVPQTPTQHGHEENAGDQTNQASPTSISTTACGDPSVLKQRLVQLRERLSQRRQLQKAGHTSACGSGTHKDVEDQSDATQSIAPTESTSTSTPNLVEQFLAEDAKRQALQALARDLARRRRAATNGSEPKTALDSTGTQASSEPVWKVRLRESGCLWATSPQASPDAVSGDVQCAEPQQVTVSLDTKGPFADRSGRSRSRSRTLADFVQRSRQVLSPAASATTLEFGATLDVSYPAHEGVVPELSPPSLPAEGHLSEDAAFGDGTGNWSVDEMHDKMQSPEPLGDSAKKKTGKKKRKKKEKGQACESKSTKTNWEDAENDQAWDEEDEEKNSKKKARKDKKEKAHQVTSCDNGAHCSSQIGQRRAAQYKCKGELHKEEPLSRFPCFQDSAKPRVHGEPPVDDSVNSIGQNHARGQSDVKCASRDSLCLRNDRSLPRSKRRDKSRSNRRSLPRKRVCAHKRSISRKRSPSRKRSASCKRALCQKKSLPRKRSLSRKRALSRKRSISRPRGGCGHRRSKSRQRAYSHPRHYLPAPARSRSLSRHHGNPHRNITGNIRDHGTLERIPRPRSQRRSPRDRRRPSRSRSYQMSPHRQQEAHRCPSRSQGSSAAESADMLRTLRSFPAGSHVRLSSLIKNTELNGKCGIVLPPNCSQSTEAQIPGTVKVKLLIGREVAVKPANLELMKC